METVATFLQIEAKKRINNKDLDIFGRSSFNRYYYSAFLEVREMLIELNAELANRKHSQIPDVLSKNIISSIDKKRIRSSKMNDQEMIRICQQAKNAVYELIRIMKEAYAVRVTADYNLDIKIVKLDNGSFALNNISIDDGYNWVTRTKVYKKKILRVFQTDV